MSAGSLKYKATRVRGLAPWSPHAKTEELLGKVQHVLQEYENYLPMTGRQIFYRLVGSHGYEKTEKAYKRLLEALNRARRSGRVDFNHLRDDGPQNDRPGGNTPPLPRAAGCGERAPRRGGGN